MAPNKRSVPPLVEEPGRDRLAGKADSFSGRRRSQMMTAEQLLSKLNELRKDYEDEDDPDNPQFLALHHAFLFLSYNMEAFKKYVQETLKSGG
jgi:hypothetical protein